MEQKQLGKTDLKIAPLAFGGNVFGWTIDEQTSFQLLDAFVAGGMNLIDTADVYSKWVPGNKGGESETIIGNWMNKRNNRRSVIIATKVGGDMGQGKKDVSRKHILEAVENSLKRLQTDYIDLYQTHWDDETTPVEETLEAYSQLIKEGKVRWIGASNISLERLKASLAASDQNGYPRYETLQPLYNLYERKDFEETFQQFCVDNNISTITYFSLASGFLTGKYRSDADLSKSQRGGGAKKYLNERGFKILAALESVAKECGSALASISLAWLMSRPSVAAPIASASNPEQLKSLLASTTLKLSSDALKILNDASEY
jgi:aryl-alcohol dehydrogenase-like predicted oxidoreductase